MSDFGGMSFQIKGYVKKNNFILRKAELVLARSFGRKLCGHIVLTSEGKNRILGSLIR